MNTRKLMLIVVLGLTIAACNRAAETVQDVDTSTTEGVTAVSSPTTTSPTTTTSTDSSTLSLVVIGDSFVGWSDWPEMYAELASTALGMTVVVDESLAGTGAPRRLDQIRSSESAQQVIASAEILVVQPQPGWVAAPVFNSYLDGECGGTGNTACFDSAKDEYSAYANEYFDLLLELVNPGTIIRVATTASWGPDGFYPRFDETTPRLSSRSLRQSLRSWKKARGQPPHEGFSLSTLALPSTVLHTRN